MSILALAAFVIPVSAAQLDGFGLSSDGVPPRPDSMAVTATVGPDGLVDGGNPTVLVPWEHGSAGALDSLRFYDDQGRVYRRRDVLALLSNHDVSVTSVERFEDISRTANRWKAISAATFWIPGVGLWTVSNANDHHASARSALKTALRDYHVFGDLESDELLVEAD